MKRNLKLSRSKHVRRGSSSKRKYGPSMLRSDNSHRSQTNRFSHPIHERNESRRVPNESLYSSSKEKKHFKTRLINLKKQANPYIEQSKLRNLSKRQYSQINIVNSNKNHQYQNQTRFLQNETVYKGKTSLLNIPSSTDKMRNLRHFATKTSHVPMGGGTERRSSRPPMPMDSHKKVKRKKSASKKKIKTERSKYGTKQALFRVKSQTSGRFSGHSPSKVDLIHL